MSTSIEITKLAYGGDGIGKLDSGKTVFVQGALPGDTVEVELLKEQRTFAKARAMKVLDASPNRIAPKCRYAGICGGCQLQTLAYQSQLEWKRTFVVDALQRIGKIANADELVRECVPSKREWEYRNKIELVPVFAGAGTPGGTGKMQLGMHGLGTGAVVPIEQCLLLPKQLQKAPKALAGALRYLKASDYDLERVSVRTSRRTGSTQVGLWTKPGYFPRKAAADVIGSAFKTTGLVRMLVKGEAAERKVSKVEILDGEEVWREKLGEFEMVASGPSFFQVNTQGAERLVELVMEGLDIQPDDVCCDLYCGTGTFTLPMAAISDDILAVESVSSSLHDLRRNLDENGLYADVIGGDALREAHDIGNVDKLVMDPPYRGMGPQFVQALDALRPSRVALVSCNPTTLARDIASMQRAGFVLEKVTPMDMFPQTFHVETVSILRRAR